MPHIRQFDHVGITVADLDSVTAFSPTWVLEVEGRTFVEGEFIDTVIGIPDSWTEIVMLRPPDGGAGVELASFVGPTELAGHRGGRSARRPAQTRFEVDDLRRPSTAWLRTDTDWSAGSVSTRTPGGQRRPRAGGNRRLADRADRLTPSGCPLPLRRSAFDRREARLVGRSRAGISIRRSRWRAPAPRGPPDAR